MLKENLQRNKKLQEICRAVFQNCFRLKPADRVLILTDALKKKEADLFFSASQEFTSQVRLIEVPLTEQSGQEPPEEVLNPLSWADVALFVTSNSLSHTEARKKATASGKRIASLPGITLDIIERSLNVYYSGMAEFSQTVAKILSGGEDVRLQASNGTDLRLSIRGRKAIADTGIFLAPGAFGNLPSGEAFIAPLEKTGEGVAVIDGNSFLAGVPLDAPIKITFRWGRAWRIKGGKAARVLQETLKKAGPKANTLAELGIGTNPRASLVSAAQGPLEAEKVFGTCHLALGSNFAFGGKIKVGFHADGVIKKPTLKIDGKIVIENGKFLV